MYTEQLVDKFSPPVFDLRGSMKYSNQHLRPLGNTKSEFYPQRRFDFWTFVFLFVSNEESLRLWLEYHSTTISMGRG